MNYKKNIGERIFDGFNYVFLFLVLIMALYPCYYVLVASLSDPTKIYSDSGLLFYPKGFGFYSYSEVLRHKELWYGYRNTIFYVLVGGFLRVLITVMTAYGLTRKNLPGKNILTGLMLFTMYFSGGLIPTYMLMRTLHLLDTPWALILSGMVSVYNVIVTMSYIRGIPESLVEAAYIDGASDYRVFFRIIIPLAKPVIAVIALYYMVEIWNDYFTGLIYLQSDTWIPLQLVLRGILIQNNTAALQTAVQTSDTAAYAENVKYAIIVVSTIPVLCIYPFIQKYFVKGVMIGAVKG